MTKFHVFGLLGCLLLAGCTGASSTAPVVSKGSVTPAQKEISARVTIDTGGGEVKGIAISPDGKTVLLVNPKAVQIWDIAGKKKVYEAKNPTGPPVVPVAISPDGKLAAYLTQAAYLSEEEEPVVLVDIPSGKEAGRLTGKKKKFRAGFEGLAFSPAGDLLVTISGVSELCGWNPKTREEQFVWPTAEAAVTAVSEIFDGGRKIATGNKEGTIRVWDLSTGKYTQTMADGDKDQISKVAVTPDGKTLVSATLAHPFRVWDVASGKLKKKVENDLGLLCSIQLLADNRTLVYATRTKEVVLVDIESGSTRRFATGQEGDTTDPLAAAVTPDGKTLATGGAKGNFKVWDLK